MLQRIYGISFTKASELDEYINLIEEAKKRDHRKLGKELDLFFFDETANKVQVKDTYFDGTRELKFTAENLKNKMNSEAELPVKEYSGKYFMENEKAAVYHDPLVKSFLSYYCINK